MKILFLSSRYRPQAVGGAERAARTLAQSVTALGDEVVVLTTDPSFASETSSDAVRVRSIPLRNVYPLSEEYRPKVLKPLWHAIDAYNLPMERAVARVLEEERPDVVHSHLLTGFSASAWGAARKARVPVVHTLHDLYLLCAQSTMMRGGIACAHRHMTCRLLTIPRIAESRSVTHVVGVSRYALQQHREFDSFAGVAGTVIPNPCHLVGERGGRSPADAGVRFGFMARVDKNKGIETLLGSVASLPGAWRLAVAGTGEPAYVAELRSRYPDPRIEFVGAVEPREFLGTVDLLIAPSLVAETFGLSAAEALAMGVPVVVSNRGALPELVEHGRNGFVFDADRPGDLRLILAGMLTDSGRLSAMADACRRSVAHLAPAVIAEAYRAVYRSVCPAAR